MANHSYDPGQAVVLTSEGRAYGGTIRELTLTTALVALGLPFDLPAEGLLEWPDGAMSEVDLGSAKAELVLRVPVPRPEPPRSDPAPPPPTDDRADLRRALRVDLSVPVRLTEGAGDAPVEGKTLNLSSGGALVVTEAPLIVGRDYMCQIELPDDPMLLKAKCLRRMGHNSYALRLLAGPDAGHRLMRRLFAMLRTGAAPLKRPFINFRKS